MTLVSQGTVPVSESLLSLDTQDALNERVDSWLEERLAVLTRFHQQAQPTSPLKPYPSSLAQQVYAKLTSYQYCGQRPANPQAYLVPIETAIAAGRPISCIVGHGPQKNPNNALHPQADWAEFFTYVHLCRLALAIQAVYPPGLQVTFYMDDTRAAFANNACTQRMAAYHGSVVDLVELMGLSRLITAVTPIGTLAHQFNPERHLAEAETWVAAWLQEPANAGAFEALVNHARRNSEPNLDPVVAARRYLTYHEAEKRSGLWSQPNSLYLRYSPHPGYHQLFTLRKGSVSQPWQGQGALCLLPNYKFDPILCTRSKPLTPLLNCDLSQYPFVPGLPLPVVTQA